MRADLAVTTVATPVGVALLYFLLAGELSWDEAIACAPVVVAACVFALASARIETVELQMALRGMGSVLRGTAAVVPDIWRVGRGLSTAVWRRPRDDMGTIKHVPFRFGGPGPEDVGRRAAVITAVSIAPNTFALGMDHVRDELLVHQLVSDPVGGDREWPL